MDEVLCYIRKELVAHPCETHKAAVLDSWWAYPYIKAKEDSPGIALSEIALPSSASEYFEGVRPALYGKSWDDVDFLYAPFNLNRDHWITLQIDLREWAINVYDCAVDLYKETEIYKLVYPVMTLLPVFISQHPSLGEKYKDRGHSAFAIRRKTAKQVKQNKRR